MAKLLLKEQIFKKFSLSEDFSHYINGLKLCMVPDKILVLSDVYSFYYEEVEMKQFKTVINLRKLNYIVELNKFLESLRDSLTKNTTFCGCFENNKTPFHIKNAQKYAKFLEAVMSIFDMKMKRLLSDKNVRNIFEVHRFKMMDMKEINGVTYFYCKKL